LSEDRKDVTIFVEEEAAHIALTSTTSFGRWARDLKEVSARQ